MTRRLLIGLVAACALVGWGCGEEPGSSSTTDRPASGVPAAGTTQIEVPKIEVPEVAIPEVPELDSAEVQALMAKAKPLLEKAQQYLKDNKLELAKPVIDELMKMKAQLPAVLQEQIDAAMKSFEMLDAKGMPKLPG